MESTGSVLILPSMDTKMPQGLESSTPVEQH